MEGGLEDTSAAGVGDAADTVAATVAVAAIVECCERGAVGGRDGEGRGGTNDWATELGKRRRKKKEGNREMKRKEEERRREKFRRQSRCLFLLPILNWRSRTFLLVHFPRHRYHAVPRRCAAAAAAAEQKKRFLCHCCRWSLGLQEESRSHL